MSIRAGLLALLANEPKHGYQLKTEFEHATGGVWKLNVGQVYTTLDRLGRDGCVAVDGTREDQKHYSITAAGREELASWWAAEPIDAPPPRDERVVKVLLAAAAGPERGLDVVTRQRTALTEVLQRRRRSRRRPRGAGELPDDLVAELAAEAVFARAEAELRWLGLCEERLLEIVKPARRGAKERTG